MHLGGGRECHALPVLTGVDGNHVVHRHDDLGAGRTGCAEEITLVGTDALLEDESGVDDR